MRRTGGRRRAALFLGLSGLAATAAATLVGAVLLGLDRELKGAGEPDQVLIRVPVAAHDLGRGAPIGDTDLMLLEVPESLVEPSVLRHAEELLGRVASEPLLAGEPIRPERLAAAEGGEGLAAILARGHRAVSVDLSGAGQVSGFVEPGNRVDILSTLPSEDGRVAETTTLLEGVLVLAVDDRAEGVMASVDTRPSVTLELGPADVERLAHASHIASLRLTLRSSIDLALTPARDPLTTDGLLGRSPEVRVPVSEFYRARSLQPEGLVLIRGPSQTVEALPQK